MVLPVHDERDNIEAVLDDVGGALADVDVDHELLVVDDGSTDGSGALLDDLAAERPPVRVVHHPQNRGYGGAIRTGIAEAGGELIAFMDADGQFRSPDLLRVLEAMTDGDVECVLGYRDDRADNPYRRGVAGIAHLVSTRMLGMDVKDVNCALKVFRAADLKPLDLRSRAGFVNAEILLAIDVASRRVEQVPVAHYPRASGTASGGRPSVILRSSLEAVWVGLGTIRRRR